MSAARLAFTVVALAGVAVAAFPTRSLAQRPQRDLITREEILQSPQKDKDLYQAIRNLRPRMLEAPRGVRTLGNGVVLPVAVFLDRARLGGVDALQTIMAADIHEVRYLEPSRAENEFGNAAGGGAIVVKMFKVIKPATPPKDTTASTRG